jgi:hypothetical protein
MTEQDWCALQAEIDSHVPGLIGHLEGERRMHEQDEERLRVRRRARGQIQPTARELCDLVAEILDRTEGSAVERMRDLSFYCFFPTIRPRHITGLWEDLSPELRIRVLYACRAGFETGEPSAISQDSRLTAATHAEATAFDLLARADVGSSWLDEAVVRRWLPVALLGITQGRWPDLIRTCWSVSPNATEESILDTINDQVRRHERPSNLRMIPTECWSERITERFICFISDTSGRPCSRSELVEILAAHDINRALPIGEEWARLPLADLTHESLRQAGRNILLCKDPETILNLVESELNERGVTCLEELHVLHSGWDSLRADWRNWPLKYQEQLARLLIRAQPIEFQLGEVTFERGANLRILLDVLWGALIQNQSAEYVAAVDRLADLDPRLRQSVATHRASASAAEVVRLTNTSTVADACALALPISQLVLDRKDFRLIRSADDLLEAVLFALDEIQSEVGHDLPLLYFPSEEHRARKSSTGRQAESERKNLHEDALQAYVRRRLLDVLGRVVEQVDVQIVREDQVAYRRRFDLRVTAPCLGTQQLATVVVEIKWSTNSDTGTALLEQLGKKYLLGESLRHGVFLVGWSGLWNPGQRRCKNRDRATLLKYLSDQRDSFCCTGQPGERLRIEPVVLNLAWQPNDSVGSDSVRTATPRAQRRKTRRKRQ